MKLIIQIPCLNEVETLPQTLADIPKNISGIDEIEILVIDDGSTDGTAEIAKKHGANHIIRFPNNRGLANAFRAGVDRALQLGADIIVNTDGDNQYMGKDIAKLVAPVVANEADIVIGTRNTSILDNYSPLKRKIHNIGTRVIQRLSHTDVMDPVSGFRAISRESAFRLNITSSFSYTTEMVIQAGQKRMKIMSVDIATNPTLRPSRLFTSIPHFVTRTAITILRTYAMYKPLKIFLAIGSVMFLLGAYPIARFILHYMSGNGDGHVQSLIIGSTLVLMGFVSCMFGILGDIIARNRILHEIILEKVRKIESSDSL